MRFFTDKIAKLGIGWNERALDELDFYRLCKRFKVSVTEMPLGTDGFYYRVKGRDFIAVNSRLSGTLKLAVLFHELGHFLFHVPESGATANFHNVGKKTRQEIEADIFALCALIPKIHIETRSTADLTYEGLPPELIAARHDIYRQHGI